ncbi:MAG TPA: hypothetical protein VIG24_11965 [Acidimicrobiia bacterium]
MQTYVGTKIVKAEPMTRQAYKDYRGWELPADENGADEGFLVEYVDGGQSNHESHEGYISWSPAEVFDNAYQFVSAIDGLAAYQVRVLAEQTQLNKRFAALSEFLGSDMFRRLTIKEQQLLRAQCKAMRTYLDCLVQRIVSF